VWESSPYLIFAYPHQLEAYRGDKWQGAVPSPSEAEGYDGSAFYNYMNVDTYRVIEPMIAETGGQSTSTPIIAAVVASVLVVGVVGLIVLRRRPRAIEHD
jgi:LPXTG-motif cell wall-anchored protein